MPNLPLGVSAAVAEMEVEQLAIVPHLGDEDDTMNGVMEPFPAGDLVSNCASLSQDMLGGK